MDVFSMLHIPILYNFVFHVWIQIDLVAHKNALGLGNKNVNIDGYANCVDEMVNLQAWTIFM